jgi:hypothetical protein
VRRSGQRCEPETGDRAFEPFRGIGAPSGIELGELAASWVTQVDEEDHDRIGLSLAPGVPVALPNLSRTGPQEVQPVAVALIRSMTLTRCLASSSCSIHASSLAETSGRRLTSTSVPGRDCFPRALFTRSKVYGPEMSGGLPECYGEMEMTRPGS